MSSGESLWELIERRVDATPDAMMAVDGDMRVMTFAEFWHEAELAAAGLLAAGVEQRDVVSWQLPTSIESMVLVGALARIGIVQNPILAQVGVEEVIAMTSEVGSALLVVPGTWKNSDVDAIVARAAVDNPELRMLVLDGALPQGDVSSLPPLQDRWSLRSRDDWEGTGGSRDLDRVAKWMFHSNDGATRVRRALHGDRSLLAAARGLVRRLGLIELDRNALVSPISGMDGILWMFAGLESGCANVIVDRGDPDEAIDVLSREGVTLVGSDDGFHQLCVEAQRRSLEPVFPDVRAFIGTGSSGSPELFEQVRTLFDVPVLSHYGPIEAPVTAMVDLVDPDHVLRTTRGRVQHGMELRVTDSRGSAVEPGVEGELRVRGSHMMLGYDDPAADIRVIDEDGLFRTGDLGMIDADGYLTITGRLEAVEMDDELIVDVSDRTYRLH